MGQLLRARRIELRQAVDDDEAGIGVDSQAAFCEGSSVEIANEARALGVQPEHVRPFEHRLGVVERQTRFAVPVGCHDESGD